MHGSSGAVRKNEIESRLQRGLPVNATALAKEFLVSEDAIRRDLRALHGLRLKFNPLPEVISGQRLIVVDDSIVRGNTTRQIVQMLRDAGAREVHMRISAPPIKHPCHYGIDMSTREEMIAHGRTTAEVAAELGCDSLHYLSLAGVYEAISAATGPARAGEPDQSPRQSHCDACFSGEYPLDGTGEANGKYALEEPAGSTLPLVRA